MQTTTNYNLKKPDVSENYNVEDFNENFVILDAVLKKVAEKAENSTAHPNDTENPHEVTAKQVGLGNVPNVTTNDQTPTYTVAIENTALTSGEKLSVAFGKIAKAVKSLISHLANNEIHHSHSNKTTLDEMTAAYTLEDKEKLSGINPATAISATLSASAWTDGAQTVDVEGITAESIYTYDVDNSSATNDIIKAFCKANLTASASENTITFTANGTTPSIDIPVTVVIL